MTRTWTEMALVSLYDYANIENHLTDLDADLFDFICILKCSKLNSPINKPGIILSPRLSHGI